MNIKRFLAIVLAFAMLVSLISVPVFAEEAVPVLISAPAGDGYTCEDLGILIGPDEDGVTEDYLDTLAKRTQAALVNLRLLGLEEAALDFDGEDTFSDAADATEFWQPVLEYLKANPGIGWVGDDEGNFLPNDYITGQAFTKILLVALGYEYGLHFDWDTTIDFATEVGLTSLLDKAEDDLTVRDIAAAIIEALGMKTTLDTDITLISKLVEDGVIDEAAALAAGFIVEEPSLIIINAYASAINAVTVVMSMDVPEDTPITLKKGVAGYSFNETVEGSLVTLETLFTLPVGTYTVTVGDSSAEFEIEAQHAVDLVIGADSVYLDDGQDLEVALVDQYGEAMSLTGTNYSVFNQTDGYVYNPLVDTTIKVDVLDDTTGDGVEAGHEIYVFVYDPASMLSASKTISVQDAPVLTEISVGGVTLGDDEAEMLFEETSGNILDVNGFDQYGNDYEITFNDVMEGTIQVLISDESVIAPMSVDFEDGDMTFYANDPGSSLVTFIIPTEAFVVSSEMITVYSDPEVVSIETAGPAETVYANEIITFPVVGFDQYGDVIDVTYLEDLMFTTTYDLNTKIGLSEDNTISFWADNDGTTTVYYFLGGVFQGTFDVTVYAEAYPFQIVGINDVPEAYLTDTYRLFSGTSLDVIDQYGRPVDMDDFVGAGYYLEISDDTDAVNLSWGYDSLSDAFVIYAEPSHEFGTETISFGIYSPVAGEVTPESIFTFDAMHVEQTDIVSYEIDVIGDLTLSDEVYWDIYGQMLIYNHGYDYFGTFYPYDLPLLFKAYLEDGTEVALGHDGDYNVPTIIDLVTMSLEWVSMDYETRSDYPEETTIYSGNGAEGECLVKAWINGEEVASTTTMFSPDKPVVTSITAIDDVMTETEFDDAYYNSEDVYYWIEELYGDGELPGEFFDTLEFFFGPEISMPWEIGVFMMDNFVIIDQYGVELHWYFLAMEGELIAVPSVVELDDCMEFYLTVMTPGGTVYDSFKMYADKSTSK